MKNMPDSNDSYHPGVPGLDPCPHCGLAVEVRPVADTPDYRIACQGCPWVVEVPGPIADVQLIVAAWNRRSPN